MGGYYVTLSFIGLAHTKNDYVYLFVEYKHVDVFIHIRLSCDT